jgi:hypothetical protein
MGTIIKFVINMEGLDADLDQIQNRLAFTLYYHMPGHKRQLMYNDVRAKYRNSKCPERFAVMDYTSFRGTRS